MGLSEKFSKPCSNDTPLLFCSPSCPNREMVSSRNKPFPNATKCATRAACCEQRANLALLDDIPDEAEPAPPSLKTLAIWPRINPPNGDKREYIDVDHS